MRHNLKTLFFNGVKEQAAAGDDDGDWSNLHIKVGRSNSIHDGALPQINIWAQTRAWGSPGSATLHNICTNSAAAKFHRKGRNRWMEYRCKFRFSFCVRWFNLERPSERRCFCWFPSPFPLAFFFFVPCCCHSSRLLPPYSGMAVQAQHSTRWRTYVSAGAAAAATRQRVIAHTLDTRLSHTRK